MSFVPFYLPAGDFISPRDESVHSWHSLFKSQSGDIEVEMGISTRYPVISTNSTVIYITLAVGGVLVAQLIPEKPLPELHRLFNDVAIDYIRPYLIDWYGAAVYAVPDPLGPLSKLDLLSNSEHLTAWANEWSLPYPAIYEFDDTLPWPGVSTLEETLFYRVRAYRAGEDYRYDLSLRSTSNSSSPILADSPMLLTNHTNSVNLSFITPVPGFAIHEFFELNKDYLKNVLRLE